MTIDEVKDVQARLGYNNWHVVWLGESGFTIAHTDAERATGLPLWDCPLHGYLEGLDGPPRLPGLYSVAMTDSDHNPFIFETILDV